MAHKTAQFIDKKNEILLEWKKEYLKAIIEALHPKGDVLEVGFGTGFAADLIQNHQVKTHTIIESNPHFIQQAKNWTDHHKNTHFFQENWQNVLPKLGVFDVILFNEYSLADDLELVNYLFQEEVTKVSADAKDLFEKFQEQMTHLKIDYQDSKIDEFYQTLGKSNFNELPSFFNKLKNNGNITDKQYERIIKKFHQDNREYKNKKGSIQESKKDNSFLFLQECLNRHMRQGSCFSCFLSSKISKFEDYHFFENIITNPHIEYREHLVTIHPPSDLHHEPHQALIMLVKKSS